MPQFEHEDKINEVLSHYGVMGMRWGVRKSRSTGGQRGRPQTTGKGAKRSSMTKRPAVSNPAVKRAQGIKTVSDEELRKMVSRMQLEKQYKDLTPSDTNMGRQYVTGILKDSGRTALTAAGSAIMLYAIKKAIQASGKVPQSELGDLTLFPKKK